MYLETFLILALINDLGALSLQLTLSFSDFHRKDDCYKLSYNNNDTPDDQIPFHLVDIYTEDSVSICAYFTHTFSAIN